MATFIGSHLTREPTLSPVLTKWWMWELMLATNFGSPLQMLTEVGGQILATKFGFVPDCWWLMKISEQAWAISDLGPWFNIKMSSYQYRKSHCGDKMVVRSSYLHNGISYTGKMTSLYWIRALFLTLNSASCPWPILLKDTECLKKQKKK